MKSQIYLIRNEKRTEEKYVYISNNETNIEAIVSYPFDSYNEIIDNFIENNISYRNKFFVKSAGNLDIDDDNRIIQIYEKKDLLKISNIIEARKIMQKHFPTHHVIAEVYENDNR